MEDPLIGSATPQDELELTGRLARKRRVNAGEVKAGVPGGVVADYRMPEFWK